MAIESNPFAILTFIAAPAVLTNASSVLALGTSNRFARSVDRIRAINKLLEDQNLAPEPSALYRSQMPDFERRARLLMRGMSAFYFSIGCFAAGSLTSLLGAILASTEHHLLLRPLLLIALVTGVAGLSGLIVGCWLLVRETRLALRMIHHEVTFYRSRFPLRS